MNRELERLSDSELTTLANLRLAVTVRLIARATAGDPELGRLASRGFVLALRAPGVPAAWIRSSAGVVTAYTGGARPSAPASLTLWFPSRRAAVRVLAGGTGTVVPLPGGPSFAAALAFFRAAAARAPAMLADASAPAALRAGLMSTAALGGIASVGSFDPALAERMEHVPDGVVAVDIPGVNPQAVEKRGGCLGILDEVPERPNARLAFRDAAAAIAVFTGKRPAVLALGSGEVVISGRIAIVQGLFAVLDRLGDYLAVRAGEAKA